MTKQELISKTKMAAMNLVNNPLCDKFYRKCIIRKVAALNFDVTTKTVQQTLEDILLIGENIRDGKYL